MNVVLLTALRAEGLDDAAIERVRAALARSQLYVAFDVGSAARRAQAERAAERDAALAAAAPYGGTIADCQATVPDAGRSVGFHRCGRRARYVVRRRRRLDDDLLVVCRTHARDPESHRYTNYGDDPYRQATADEPIESEYRPEETR